MTIHNYIEAQNATISKCDIWCSECKHISSNAEDCFDGLQYICEQCQYPGEFLPKGANVSMASRDINVLIARFGKSGLRTIKTYSDSVVAYFRVVETGVKVGNGTPRIQERKSYFVDTEFCKDCGDAIGPAYTVETETALRCYEEGPKYVFPVLHRNFICAEQDLHARYLNHIAISQAAIV